jgi:hypothetical protein
MVRAARAMVTATRVAGNKEGDGDGNSMVLGNGDNNEGGWHATATRVTAKEMVS